MSAAKGVSEPVRTAVPQAREREEFCRDLARIRLRIYREQTVAARSRQQQQHLEDRPHDDP